MEKERTERTHGESYRRQLMAAKIMSRLWVLVVRELLLQVAFFLGSVSPA